MAPFLQQTMEYCEEFHNLSDIEQSKNLRQLLMNMDEVLNIGYNAAAMSSRNNDNDENNQNDIERTASSLTMDSNLSDDERKRKELRTKLHPYEIATLINIITPNLGTEETIANLPSLKILDGQERFTRAQVRDVLRNMKDHLGYEVDWNYTSEDEEEDEEDEEEDEDEDEKYNAYSAGQGIYEYNPSQEDGDGDLDSLEDLKDPPQYLKEEAQDTLEDEMQMETGNISDGEGDLPGI